MLVKYINYSRWGARLLLLSALIVGANFSFDIENAYALDETGGCSDEYVGGIPPQIQNTRLEARLAALCYTQFAIYHSGVTATPLWTAQHLTANDVRDAYKVDRNDVFHPEDRLPKADRAELSHYRKSGYDRGHLAPAADMATVRSQDESFSMANMIPQMPQLNRGPWAEIEKTSRELALNYGEIYIVTGPVFLGSNLSRIGGRVFVPSDVFKAIYIPSTGQSSAWWASNSSGSMEVVSIVELTQRIGIDVFPAVQPNSKTQKVGLPLPGAINNPRPPKSNQPSTSSSQQTNAKTKVEKKIINSVIDFAIDYLKK